MKRITIAVVSLSACVLAPACQAIVGIEERTEAPPIPDAADAATTVSDAGSDGPPTLEPDAAPPAGCPADCLPPAPTGWTGPSATYDGIQADKPANCPASYAQKELEAHVGLSAAATTCDCGAPVVTGRKCTAGVVTYADANCTQLPTIEGNASSGAGCFVTTNGTNGWYKLNAPNLVPGTCTFPNAKATVPPATFAKVQVACGLSQTTACVARPDCVAAPAPAAPFTRVCIHKDGDVSCPSQDYAQRFVGFKNVDDTRACSACSATPTGGVCGNIWGTNSSQIKCSTGPAPNDKAAGTCYAYPGIGTLVDINSMGPGSATCTPSGGAPTGAATSLEPVTFCCNQ